MPAELPDVPGPTARLAFRAWRDDEAALVLDMYSRPEVCRFLGATPSPAVDLEDAAARIERWRGRTHGLCGVWAIVPVDHPTAVPYGTMLLVPLPRTDGLEPNVHEIGWHLHPDAWGHGFATEAAGALIERARAAGLTEVRAVVYPDNAPSRAVCARLGMSETGLTDEWYEAELVEYVLPLA